MVITRWPPPWHPTNLTLTPDYYSVLGLSRDASDQEIIRAWRKAVLLHHPDKRAATSNTLNSQSPARERTEQTYDAADIRLINEAKWVLGDPVRRKDWEDSFYSSEGRSEIKVDATPHVSYDISLSSFTPHYRSTEGVNRENGLEQSGETAAAEETEDEEPIYYTHPCRCSSEFVITYQDLVDGVDVVGCGGCGEWVRVGYEAVTDDEA